MQMGRNRGRSSPNGYLLEGRNDSEHVYRLTQPTQRSVTVTVTLLPLYVALIFLPQMGLPNAVRGGVGYVRNSLFHLSKKLTVRVTASIPLESIKQQLRHRADVVRVLVRDSARSESSPVEGSFSSKGLAGRRASATAAGRRCSGCSSTRGLGFSLGRGSARRSRLSRRGRLLSASRSFLGLRNGGASRLSRSGCLSRGNRRRNQSRRSLDLHTTPRSQTTPPKIHPNKTHRTPTGVGSTLPHAPLGNFLPSRHLGEIRHVAPTRSASLHH